jgi:exopolysaccharide biosynthesis polyprenyl glycosylphosphotransferase
MKKGIYKRNLFVPFLKILSDVISIALANLLAYQIRFNSAFTEIIPVIDEIPPFDAYLYFGIINILIFLILFSNYNSYRSRYFSTFSEDITIIFKVCTLAILFSMGFGFLYREFSYSRLVFFLIYIDSIILLLITRFIFHRFKFYFLQKGYNVLNVILAGSSSLLERIYHNLKENNIYRFDFAGYISSEKCALPLEYIGDSQNVSNISQLDKCDGFILAYDSKEHYNMLNILKFTEGKNFELFYVPDILDLLTSHINVLEINGTPLFQFKTFSLSGWQGLLKRTFDFILSLFSIIILSPIFFLLAVIIKLDSKGSVFYKQKRVSLDGKEFNMIKFRSMQSDAESASGPVWANKNDPRTTSVGKFIRRTSLDEIPQLWNILIGEMSLVGPRPERLHFINQFKDDIPKYLERHRLRSGMTGWAQVNGLRGQSPIEERTKFDLFYIENWSLWFDIKIIIMTFIAIFKGKNAY